MPQNYTLKTITPQDFQANFNHSIDLDVVTIANIQGEGLIDADGLEYNIAIPDKNDALAIFRITQKNSSANNFIF